MSFRRELYSVRKVESPKREETIVQKTEEIIQQEEVLYKKDEIVYNNDFDIDKLAYAVAYHETKDCTLGYGASYNNCFWIKLWRTAPCENVGKNKMCIYNSPEESYEAFKKIWTETWYNWYPTLAKAISWSWNDRASEWLNTVLYIYNNI